jgi:radical SAM protein with 4Fe4S-binding SPASM domain
MTLIPATAPLLCDSIIYLAENIGFQTVNCILAGGVEWTPETIDVIKAEITRLTDWWIDKARGGKWYGLYHLANMFRGLWSGQRKRTLCDAGKSRVAVDTRGDLWPCHRFCNLDSKPEYRLGNIETGYTNLGLYQRLKSFDLAAEYADRCASCSAALGCHAFCLHETMIAGGNALAAPKDYTCRLWPHYWSEAVRAHETLTRENNALYLAKRQASRKTS